MKRKAIFLLYRVLQAIALPAIAAYLLIRVFRNRQYLLTLRERFGVLPALWQKTAPGAIWLHAVSVGEVLAAIPLIEQIKERSPRSPIFLSVTTLAGRSTADRRLTGLTDGIFYVPLDFVWAIRRLLRCLRPSLVIVMETEIWPNLFREVTRTGCGLTIVNGRISDRALPRYRRFAWLFGPVLGLCDRIVTQSDEMRSRYIEAGAPAEIVEVAGNLKYDIAPGAIPGDSPVLGFLRTRKNEPIWIAASTSADGRIEEEDIVIAAQLRLPGWRLILAPRKPERFEAVARKLGATALSWTRRTQPDNLDADVLLLDSIGELSGLLAHASVVFMGGTIAEKGGHNILEPALFGKPVIAGPHLENFRDIEAQFQQHNALLRIDDGEQLAGAIRRAASDPDIGRRALKVATMHRGSAARIAESAVALYNSKYPCDRPSQPGWMFLWCLSQLWRAGSAWDRRRKRRRTRRLPVPVVSIGNITAGGTGKTPFTIELLREFSLRHPGLLTRGHGRSTSEIVLLPKGDEEFPIDMTGDEAQLYLRAMRVPIGIGADRYEAGTRLLGAAEVQLLLLDDGFQHVQLARDFDLVLIDSLHPFGGGHLLPLGRLREPLEGLARANAFVITRENEAANVEAIVQVLHRYNATAPVFFSRTVAKGWCGEDGATLPLDAFSSVPSLAFCGLGNPRAFWRTLDRIHVNTLSRLDYGDHHRYSPVEVRRVTQHAKDLGVEVLLTTAKDAVNLCPEVASIVAPLRLYWLDIAMEIDNRHALVSLIASHSLTVAAP